MKKQKNAKTELERRLEEEVRQEAQTGRRADGRDSGVKHELGVKQSSPLPENPGIRDMPETSDDAIGETIDQELHELEAELNLTKDQLLRTHAEFDNYRKRTLRESERFRKLAAENVIRDLLPVMDNLDLALQHAEDRTGGLAQGVEMVLKQFVSALEKHGLKPIPSVGEPFDPRVHEAVTVIPSESVEADNVAQEFQRGYMLGDQIIRPSKVAVSKGASTEQQGRAAQG